jgi:hypothetical protein
MPMAVNLGLVDRTLRLLIGLTLLAWGGGGVTETVLSVAAYWLTLTGIFRVCPLYIVLGLDSTARSL